MSSGFSCRRLWALCRKETKQILRDPSSNIIAFVLPVVMLFIYGYGINLDTSAMRIGLQVAGSGPEAQAFATSLTGSPFMEVHPGRTTAELENMLVAGDIRGFVIVPADFDAQIQRPGTSGTIQIITDGTEPNTASFIQNYVRGAWAGWQQQRAGEHGFSPPAALTVEPRFWYNPSAQSRNYLIPGSITVIMTVIGTLLTSLVVAREWERGTMEALLASPVTRAEIVISKILPYYVLGIISLFLCVGVAVFVLGVPFRGSLWVLWAIGTLFLGGGLGLGLLLSTVLRNQFNAAQAALNAAYLPALILSGFIYEISSMPVVIRAVTYLIPAKYFVTAMQTVFQAGDIWSVLLKCSIFLALSSMVFLGLTALKTRLTLDD